MHDTRTPNHPYTDPLELAESWAAHLQAGLLDELMEMYSSRAPLHTAGDVVVGAGAIREFWEDSRLLGGRSPERVVRANGVSVVQWSHPPGEAGVTTTELLIRHGHIVEQWVGEALLTESVLGAIPLEFSHSGGFSDGDRQGLIEAIEKVLEGVDEPVTHVRVRMEHAGDRNRNRPTSLRAVVDMRRGAVRAEVHADTTRAAIDELESRLRTQLRDRSERRTALQHRGTGDSTESWRHGDRSSVRPSFFPRPREEREVVRHKSVAPVGSDVEEAVFDLSSMDYDFYLFTDAATDRDALVFHDEQNEQYVVRFAGEADTVDLPQGVVEHPASVPSMNLAGARERLDVGRERWVFFRDVESQRGHVLYRRYDGHYGLIVPIDEPD